MEDRIESGNTKKPIYLMNQTGGIKSFGYINEAIIGNSIATMKAEKCRIFLFPNLLKYTKEARARGNSSPKVRKTNQYQGKSFAGSVSLAIEALTDPKFKTKRKTA